MASTITGPRGYVVGVDEFPGKEEKEQFQATLIQLGGTVTGSKGRGYLNYLTLGGGTPGQAFNLGRVQERAGVPVWVSWFKDEPVIMHVDKSRMEPNGARGYRSPLFAQHAPDHGWGSGDPDYVDSRRIKELMVRPAGEFKVNISPGRYGSGLGYAYFAGQQNYDLAAYQPAVAGTKRKIGLYLDSAGAVQVVEGGLVAVTAVIPELDWPAGVFRLVSVILFESKDFIDFEYVKQEKALWINPVVTVSSLAASDGSPNPAWSVDASGNLDNPGGGIMTAPATESVFKVKNTSGAAAAVNEIGYLSELGEYKTTTTAALDASWCTVVIGGANNADIYVANRGRFTVKYTGTAPSAGHFLTTSTVAGSALRSTTMQPMIFAVCLGAGSGGLVEVLLLCNTPFFPVTNSNDIYRIDNHSSTLFIATINGAPLTTSVVYNAPSSGQEDCIVPQASTQLAKARLHNTTRGTYRLITAVNTGTNTIMTVASTDAWASGDTITIESQTVTSPSGLFKFVDLDLSQQTAIPVLARALMFEILKQETGTTSASTNIHSFDTFASSKEIGVTPSLVANSRIYRTIEVPLIQWVFTYRSFGTGTGTVTFEQMKLMGYWMAAP